MKTSLFSSRYEAPLRGAIQAMELAENISSLGGIYTRVETIDFILDLVGYTPDKQLYSKRLLEPSIGNGDFLIQAIRRLVASWKLSKPKASASKCLLNSLTGIELHVPTLEATRNKVEKTLTDLGIDDNCAEILTKTWLKQGDFLHMDFDNAYDFVVGNPPYVRQELIPSALVNAYRNKFASFFDRADLYIPFIEKGLHLLGKNGHLGFICSDRWMKNKYGGPLRKIISEKYHLKYYVDMVDTAAFQDSVSAYPAITVFSQKNHDNSTVVAYRPKIDAEHLNDLTAAITGTAENDTVIRLSNVTQGDNPWSLESSLQTELVAKLERQFPTLEETGCKVGIGVATGADKIFIAPYDSLDVETDRKLPLVQTKDILTGEICWRGMGVINPFNDDGTLVSLSDYPRLKRYLDKHKKEIVKRHVASKNPQSWYRTIDRISPSLLTREKLLIPDIKGDAQIVLDNGEYYPHHNLYYIVSDKWNLQALQAVLKSGIARMFVAHYSTKMRGGYLRFQAQYLRRIRLPEWNSIPVKTQQQLITAKNSAAINNLVCDIYKLNDEERNLLANNTD